MVHDQADELRQLVLQRARAGAPAGPAVPLIIVSGGKGGVGTTTIAVNLSIALARQGRRAVFVDADLDHGGNVFLGQHQERGSVLDVLNGRRGVHEVLERGPSGIQVISGAWATGGSGQHSVTAQQRFVGDLKSLSPHAEVIVVDAGNGRGPFARQFWQAASAVVVVCTIEAAAIMESYAAVKVLLDGQTSIPLHTLVNLADDAALAADVHQRLAAACQRFLGLRSTASGSVPRGEAAAATDGVLIYPPQSVAARTLDRTADALWAHLQVTASRESTARRQQARSA